jgi:hypothetical protein
MKWDVQVCNVKMTKTKNGSSIIFPPELAGGCYAREEVGKALVLLTNEIIQFRKIYKRGKIDSFCSADWKGTVECLMDKKVWKICFHNLRTAVDEDPS